MRRTRQKVMRYPVTHTQRDLLERTLHPECKDDPRNSWVISSATLVRPRVDLRRLRRAYQKLLDRHDSLRIQFEQDKNKWWAVIADQVDAPIEEVDIGDVDDDTFHREVVEIASAPMSLIGCAQVEIALLRCGARGDVVVWRINDSITDGFGNIVLVEDLLKYLIGMPVTGRAVSHAEYIGKYQDAPAHRVAEFDAFWEEMHRSPPLAPNIGRKAKGMPPNVLNCGAEPRRLSVVSSQNSVDRLRKRAAAANTQFVSSLFAGFLEALCQNYAVEELLFSTNASRVSPALASFGGHATLYPILRYKVAGTEGMEQAARSLGTSYMAAFQHSPAQALYKGSALERKLVEAGAYPRQFDCNLPNPSTLRDRSVFSDGLKKAPGEDTVFGGFAFSGIALPEFNWGPYDMMFRIDETQGAEGFHLLYDGISFDETEVRHLADRICSLLDLDPDEFSTGSG